MQDAMRTTMQRVKGRPVRPWAIAGIAVAVAAMVCIPAVSLSAAEERASVVRVGDGDTLTVARGNRRTTIRLACVDAPERRQPYGKEAAMRLHQLLPPRAAVGLQVVDGDRYGRAVAIAQSGSHLGTNINVQLVREGLAWVYEEYLEHCPDLAEALWQAQTAAQREGRGLWAQSAPCHPQDFRRGQCEGFAAGMPTGDRPILPKVACDPSYPGVCIPPAPPDLDCRDISYRRFAVTGSDPHRFDGDRNGIGCER